MNARQWFRNLLAIGCIVLAGQASAAVLKVDGDGKLAGASGVLINGGAYDVDFVDGSCIAIFDGCDAAADFLFQTAESALAASLALLDQVLINSALGSFDDNITLTKGCGSNGRCAVFTPFDVFPDSGGRKVEVRGAMQISTGSDVITTTESLYAASDFSVPGDEPSARVVFAVWAPSSSPSDPGASGTVPAPSTALLLAVGLALLGTVRGRESRGSGHAWLRG